MYKVTTIKVIERSGENVSFNCDSYQKHDGFYVFSWCHGSYYSWSHSIEELLIKSIEKL